MRTLIDIPEEDLKLLNQVVKKLSISRAEFVRQAVEASGRVLITRNSRDFPPGTSGVRIPYTL